MPSLVNLMWTDDDDAYLRDHYATQGDTEIAAHLTRTTGRRVTAAYIRKKRHRLGLRRDRPLSGERRRRPRA